MRRKSRVRPARQEDDRQFIAMSRDVNFGTEALRVEDLASRECPATLKDIFKQARRWQTENWFVEQITLLKTSFYNYGLRFVVDKKDKAKLDALKEDKVKFAEVLRLVNSVWNEWHLHDNVIGFWRESGFAPFLLKPEICDYSDAMGVEKLRVVFPYTMKNLETERGVQGMARDLAQRYSGQKEILLSEDRGEFFKVLTRGLKGFGLGTPRMRAVFRTLSSNESMEVSEAALSHASRLILRRHKIGFEVKAGVNSMRQESFLYKKKRADEILKYMKGRAGTADTVSQFDHAMEYFGMVDPKFYDVRKWDSPILRLMWWGGPLGWMMTSKTLAPFLLGMLKTQAIADRETVGLFLEEVLARGFKLDFQLKLQWSNRCFADPRLAWDMIKFFTAQGPLSLKTGLEEGDFDPEEEASRKRVEAKPERKNELLPLFDPAHGHRPGEPDGPGKPKTKA